MAKQHGLHPLTGTVGGMNYYYDKNLGYLVRSKPGPTKNQVKRSPAFARVRHNYKEFGAASSFARQLYDGFRPFFTWCKDKKCWPGLLEEVRSMLLMDTEHVAGERQMTTYALQGFDHFELDCESLSKKYFDQDVMIDARDGVLEAQVTVNLPQRRWGGIERFEVYSIVASIDQNQLKARRNMKYTSGIPYAKGTYVFPFTHQYVEKSWVFHGVCLVFYERCARTGNLIITKREHRNTGYIRFVG